MNRTLRGICGASIACGLALCCTPSGADQLRLKNGDRVTGRLISLTPRRCVFATDYAATLQIEPADIAGLTTTGPVALALNGGDRIVGTLDGVGQGVLFVRSERFGHLSLSLEEVAEIARDPDPHAPRSAALPEPPRTAAPAAPAAPSPRPVPADGSPAPAQSGMVAGAVTVLPRGAYPETPRLLQASGRGSRPDPEQTAQETPENRAVQGGTQEPSPPAERFGQEQRQDEETRRIFLRQETVLLAPGDFQGEAALIYLRDRSAAQVTDRELTLAPTLRFGLLTGLEGFLTIPVTWAEEDFVIGTDQRDQRKISNDNFGIGDLRAGLKYQLVREHGLWPDIIASAGLRAPTGDAPDIRAPRVGERRAVGLGTGRWETSAAVTFVRSFDPAVLFGTAGYTHVFDGNVRGVNFSGGSSLDYSFGLGFAINDAITLSGQFLGAYQTELKRNGRTLPGSDREPMLLRSSLTYRFSRNEYIEPSILYGLNEEATDAVLGLSYVRQF